MSNKKTKVIVILGQTATGKSDLGVKLARRFNGEIISADSRQIYKGLDIGTGKIAKKEMRSVPHYMLDVVSSKRQFTVVQYKQRAEKIMWDIAQKGKIPIVVGGTGFYIDALLGGVSLPNVPPDKRLRKRLGRKSAQSLFENLKKLDPHRAKVIDKNNKVRLIRAIEIARVAGKVPLCSQPHQKYDALKIGIRMEDAILKQKIHARLLKRIRAGMIAEVKKLHARGLSWKRMEELGLEYRYISRYLKQVPRGSTSDSRWSAFQAELETAIWQYARRQRTWFKRDKTIHWFAPFEYKKIQETVKRFLY